MPVTVRYRPGTSRPWKIVEKATGRVVGSSISKTKAESSARARNAAHFNKNWKPRKRK
jgi:hypothetical protein